MIELGEAAAVRTLSRGFVFGRSRVPSQTSNSREKASVGDRRGGGRDARGASERRGSFATDCLGHTGLFTSTGEGRGGGWGTGPVGTGGVGGEGKPSRDLLDYALPMTRVLNGSVGAGSTTST